MLLADIQAAEMHTLNNILAVVTGAGALAGIAYSLACLWSARRYLRARTAISNPAVGATFPPVSILKPLKGEDPEIYESFRSHCLQEYPQYEIIFGVSEAGDPAVLAVERLRREFPQRAIHLVACSQTLGANTKVSNLVQMLAAARYDHLIVSDSDIRVEHDYLRRVMAPLADAEVGMVTCLYRGIAGPTLGSRLESLGISTDFCAGVLVARSLESSMRFGLGSTMVFRRRDLQAMEGFESLAEYLADDYELGKRIAALGLEVRLSEVVVETFLPAYNLRAFFEHQSRWARGVRDSRPAGYLGLLFTFSWPWALLALLVSRGAPWAWGVAVSALFLRFMVAWTVGSRVLEDRQIASFLPLLPLRDIVAALVWLASFASNTVAWRGNRFHLKDGKIIRLNPQK